MMPIWEDPVKGLVHLLSQPGYQARYEIARRTRTCVNCGMTVDGLRDESSTIEYLASGLCRDCQDRFFGRS